jgi:hypothetical protein
MRPARNIVVIPPGHVVESPAVAPIPECSCSAPVRVPFLLVLATCVVVALCAFALSSCAPSLHGKRWAPDSVTVVIDPHAPRCAEWTVQEAWRVLRPRKSLAIQRGGEVANGRIAWLWGHPADYPRTLAVTYPFGDQPSWADSDVITRAVIVAGDCSPRLLAHELGHALGLPHAERGLMAPVYHEGTYELSRRQRRALR